MNKNQEYFSNIENLNGFKVWLFNGWFSEAYKDKLWYNNNITQENILEEISFKHFPYTISQLKELWDIKNGLGSYFTRKNEELNQISFEEEGEESSSTKPKKRKYNKAKTYGANTFHEVAEEFTGMTKAYVQIIQEIAERKIRKLFTEKEDMLFRLDQEKETAANDYTNELLNYKGRVFDFIVRLNKLQILSRYEMEHISQEELFAIDYLLDKPKELIVEILLEDIESKDNIYKSFQNFLSRRIFPHKKRGNIREKSHEDRTIL